MLFITLSKCSVVRFQTELIELTIWLLGYFKQHFPDVFLGWFIVHIFDIYIYKKNTAKTRGRNSFYKPRIHLKSFSLVFMQLPCL